MNWLTLILFSLLFLGAFELFSKKYIESNSFLSANTLNIVTDICVVLCIMPFFFITHQTFSHTPAEWSYILIQSACYTFAVAFFYESYKYISASLAVIIGMVSLVVSNTMGIYLFQETMSPVKILGILMIVLSISLLHWERSLADKKGYLLALLGGLIFGAAYTMDKYIVSVAQLPGISLLFFGPLIGIVLKMCIQPKDLQGKLQNIKKSSLIYPFLCGACVVGAYLLIYSSYRVGGEVGKIDAINNLTVFVVIAGEVFLFKDRSQLMKKISCAIIALLGVWFLR